MCARTWTLVFNDITLHTHDLYICFNILSTCLHINVYTHVYAYFSSNIHYLHTSHIHMCTRCTYPLVYTGIKTWHIHLPYDFMHAWIHVYTHICLHFLCGVQCIYMSHTRVCMDSLLSVHWNYTYQIWCKNRTAMSQIVSVWICILTHI